MRNTPGTVPVAGRKFTYIPCDGRDEFEQLFAALSVFDTSPLPASGGILSENAQLITPDGESYFALSYKGDLPGWERLVAEFCREHRLTCASVDRDMFQVDGGVSAPMDQCKILFF